MSLKIAANKLLNYSTSQLWDNLGGEFTLTFEDGEVATNYREVLYSSYGWDLHRRFPKTPLRKGHHVRAITKGKDLVSGAHLQMLNAIYWDVYDTYAVDYPDVRVLIDDLNLMVYQITNRMYNELSVKLERHVTSLDIIDFIAITKHAPIEKLHREAAAQVKQLFEQDVDITASEARRAIAQARIESINNMIQREINESEVLRRNPLAISVRIGVARMGQALQCLGVRGFVTDVGSNIFPKPVMSGYIHGIRSLYASMIESRSAAKALMNTTKPLQDSEYFSRRQQLVCMNIRNLHMCDCGSTEYLNWTVRDKRMDGLKEIPSDLETIAGKFYLDEETNTLKIVRKSDKHLIGKTLRLRSVTAGCNIPGHDPNGVCFVCYGETGLALPANSNLGHMACVTMTAILGQLILSTKHFESSSSVEGINLNNKPQEKKFLSADVGGNAYYLSDRLKNKKQVTLQINVDDAKGLPNLRLVSNIDEVNMERTSQFDQVLIGVMEQGSDVTEYTSLTVRVQHRQANLTPDFLAYIKKKGYTLVRDARDGKYEFDLSEWDYSKPIFTLPMRHFNMSNHQGEIAKMLESTAEEMEKRSKHVLATNMLLSFHDLVNRLLNVNLSVLDAIIYSSMVVDVAAPNYDLPSPGTERQLGVLRQLLEHRSLSAMLAYQNHRTTITNPSSYTLKNRLDHPFDVLFMPAEVLEHQHQVSPMKALPY